MSRPTRDTPAGRAYLDLQNRARREGKGTQELLTMYVVERWLSRLSRSPYHDDFILKGGMLLAAFDRRRPTTDADALARNMAADEATVARRVAEIAQVADNEDGVEFRVDTLATEVIREEAFYSGVRVSMTAQLSTANVKLKLDINFGDPVTPAPQIVELPALRPGVEPVRVLGYPVETVLAEKITTAISLGAASTRVRDWADIYTLIETRTLTCGSVRDALRATASFRGTELVPLSSVIGQLVRLRASTYTAYRRRLGPDGEHLPSQFQDVVDVVVAFVDPVIAGAEDLAHWSASSRSWAFRISRP
ncbi:MAG: nucleotidyl transferase AbiEii/AbiGii toxin family protein [Nocardiaceae bacterium]|nr:nucleotidyl transferase AbiEii/AbiGii toxin family protein [Nocardiaceae bacterium]